MNLRNLFDNIGLAAPTTKVMFVNFGKAEEEFCLPLLTKVRRAGISAEIYPDHVKLKKQFDYANKKQIPFVVVIGENEIKTGKITLKNMNSGEQNKMEINELIATLIA